MWVDNPLSLAGGREIYGYNKNWGWIDLAADGVPGGLKLDAYGGNFDGKQRAGRHPLIEVAPGSGGSVDTGGVKWEGLDGLAGAIRGTLMDRATDFVGIPGLDVPGALFDEIVRRGGPPQIFLKQFRSVSHGRRATGQQITDAGVTVNRIDAAPLLSDFEFTLHHLDSHPVEAELGVASQTTSLGFEIHMDFVLNDGTVLWQAPGG
jgi:hypothetical protein